MACTNRKAFLIIALWCFGMHALVVGLLFASYRYLNNPTQHQYTMYQCALSNRGSVNTEQVSPLFVRMKTFYRIYWSVHYRAGNTSAVSNATLVTPWVENKADLAPYLHLPEHTIVDCWGPPQDYELISASPVNWPNPLRSAQAETETFVMILGSGMIIAFGAAIIYALAQYNIIRNEVRHEYIGLNR